MGGDTFFADILCNNQLYIDWGGGIRYGLFLISFACLILIMLGTEEHWYTNKLLAQQ